MRIGKFLLLFVGLVNLGLCNMRILGILGIVLIVLGLGMVGFVCRGIGLILFA